MRHRANLRESADPLDRGQVGPVPFACLDGVPLAGSVLKPPTPLGDVRAVLGVACPVLGHDHPEATLGQKAEGIGVMFHRRPR